MSNKKMSSWDRVLLARHNNRPTAKTLIKALFPDFLELHGDRLYSDDKAVIGGLAMYNKQPVTIIGIEKGISTFEKIEANFGMPHPEGYRKALRLMKQAEKFNRPIITIIDTPGAYPGVGAEERGQHFAIANNLKEMMLLKVPIITIVLGEGGSGGALAIGVADRILMFENSVYAILSPEGFASILFKDSSRAMEAAEVMKITAEDLFSFGIADEIIEEGEGLHIYDKIGFTNLDKALKKHLNSLLKLKKDKLTAERYQKFRKIGEFVTLEEEKVDED